jgi:hypothetical protein
VNDADLRRRQADSDGVVHQVAHALDLLAQGIVEPFDRTRLGAQHRIAELTDLGEGGLPASGSLGIELGLPRIGVSAGLDVFLEGLHSGGFSGRIGHGMSLVRRDNHSTPESLRVDVDAHAYPAADGVCGALVHGAPDRAHGVASV